MCCAVRVLTHFFGVRKKLNYNVSLSKCKIFRDSVKVDIMAVVSDILLMQLCMCTLYIIT